MGIVTTKYSSASVTVLTNNDTSLKPTTVSHSLCSFTLAAPIPAGNA